MVVAAAMVGIGHVAEMHRYWRVERHPLGSKQTVSIPAAAVVLVGIVDKEQGPVVHLAGMVVGLQSSCLLVCRRQMFLVPAGCHMWIADGDTQVDRNQQLAVAEVAEDVHQWVSCFVDQATEGLSGREAGGSGNLFIVGFQIRKNSGVG